MKNILLLIAFCSLQVLGQQNSAAEKQLQGLLEWARITDSIVKDSRTKHYDFTHITERITEGSVERLDSINGKQVETASGGFSKYTFTDRNTNQIIKSIHNYSIHYNEHAENTLKGKSEITKIDIYYRDEEPIFAMYLKKIQDKDIVVNRKWYYVQLVSRNNSQKSIRDYILNLCKDVIPKKK